MVRQVKIQKKKKNATRIVVQPKKAEVTALGKALRMLGGLGGGALGNLAGVGAPGAVIGQGLGAQLSRWLGQGDYQVATNSLLRQSASGVVPMMHQNGQSVVVRHKEFVTEVTGKTAFTVQRRLSINPGLSQTFPWLSGVAAQYTEYTIKGMVYHYVPTSGNAVSSTNAALGTVMLQTSYRANEAAPSSKVEMLNEYWSNEAKPSEPFCHPIECDPKENPFNVQYIRTGSVPSTDNVLLYDLGTTTLAVSGQQADDIVLGDLWVTYEIELRKPRLTDLTGESLPTFKASSTANINTTTPFGTDMVESVDSTTGGASISSTAITFSPGNVGTYAILCAYTGVTAFNDNGASFVGCTAVNGIGNSLYFPSTAQTTTSSQLYVINVQITNPNSTSVITPAFAVLTGATALSVYIIKINPSLLV